MDEKLLELANVLKNTHADESSLTVRWAVVLSVVVAVLAFLFGGYVTNVLKITKLETTVAAEKEQKTDTINAIRADYASMRQLVQEIRDNQIRLERKER